jgi:hypothetical protein
MKLHELHWDGSVALIRRVPQPDKPLLYPMAGVPRSAGGYAASVTPLMRNASVMRDPMPEESTHQGSS